MPWRKKGGSNGSGSGNGQRPQGNCPAGGDHNPFAGWTCNKHGDSPHSVTYSVSGCDEPGFGYEVCSKCHNNV
jgi:hypothetical protein